MKYLFGIFLLLLAFATPLTTFANNLHLIDGDKSTGFEIYRSGKPDSSDMQEFCRLGISEIMVLSGDADKNELKLSSKCKSLKVIYNYKQSANTPVSKDFLNYFDQWVESSREQGKKIAFRCSCGCHRTGRLAAYYRMKYNGYDSEAAIDEMYDLGKWMLFYPGLKKQVRAMEDYLLGRPCDQKAKYCVRQ